METSFTYELAVIVVTSQQAGWSSSYFGRIKLIVPTPKYSDHLWGSSSLMGFGVPFCG